MPEAHHSSLVAAIGHPIHIVLHIGTTKTGSTSFQNYMEHHREALAAKGVLFPKSGFIRQDLHDLERTPGHLGLFRTMSTGNVEDFVTECRTFYQNCADPLSARIVLSVEELFHYSPDALAAFFPPKSNFFEGVNFSILAVLRNPYEWLYSRYQERVLGGWAVEASSFDAFIVAALASDQTNYPLRLDNFRTLFPTSDITVLSYDQLASSGRLVEAMLDAIGHPNISYIADIKKQSNVSAKIGLGVEAIRRVALFTSCLDRDLRQLWRKRLVARFASVITTEDSQKAPRIRQETRSALANHATSMNHRLAASYIEGGVSIQRPESWREGSWSRQEEQRIDDLADIALVELQYIIEAFPDRMQQPNIGIPLSVQDCSTAADTRKGFHGTRIITMKPRDYWQ